MAKLGSSVPGAPWPTMPRPRSFSCRPAPRTHGICAERSLRLNMENQHPPKRHLSCRIRETDKQ